MRLDVFLAQAGLAKSRTEAQQLIKDGRVRVGDRPVAQSSFAVDEQMPLARVEIDRPQTTYVGRGGLKLAAALDTFSLSPEGLVCLDVGASTGGFTDCLLRRGAAHVYAVDAGQGQLAPSLRADSRVTVYENYNARHLSPADFPLSVQFAVMDVSFISQTLILPALSDLLCRGGLLVSLVKPQFELTRAALDKKGVVKSEPLRREALCRVRSCAQQLGFDVCAEMRSPITGGDGNTEYLICFQKGGDADEHA